MIEKVVMHINKDGTGFCHLINLTDQSFYIPSSPMQNTLQ